MAAGLNIQGTTPKISKDIELVHAQLERLFFIGIGEQIGFLDQGSRIKDYFFEAANEFAALAILDEARELILNYQPNIQLSVINVAFTQLQGGTLLTISIEFNFEGDDSQTYSLSFNKIRT